MVSTHLNGATRESTDAERVELILSQITELPTLPAVAIRVLQATHSEHTSARDVVRVLESDPALTAKMLTLLRRSDLGVDRNVISVDRAVVLLGFHAVRNAVLSIQVYDTFAACEPGGGSALVRSEFWKHGLAVACAADLAARELARPEVRPEDAFVCGLLHDIGKIALDACLPKSYARVLRRCEQRQACICDAERDILGLDHAQAGRRLLTHWRLPRPVVECAWLHHQSSLPDSVESRPLIEVVHWADLLVRRQRIGFSGYRPPGTLGEPLPDIGLPKPAVDVIIEALPGRLEELAGLFGLDGVDAPSLYARAVADANVELARLNTQLSDANRRLEYRSRFFETIRGFVSTLGDGDDVGSVCAAVAAAMGRMFGGTSALMFAAAGSRRFLHLGVWTNDGSAGAHRIVDRASVTTDAGTRPGPDRRVPAIGEATPRDRALWANVVRTEPRCPLWFFPIVSAGRALGGVLFPVEREAVFTLGTLPDECEALSTTFGLALASATARARAESLSEDLLDMNRRLKAAQDEVLRTRSLSMIAEMAAGAAHELNNPLAVISGRAQMLARDDDQPETRDALDIIGRQARRASDIVTELLQFARPDSPKPVHLRVADVFERACQHWNDASTEPATRPTFEVLDPDAAVFADADQLATVLDALIANALDATESNNGRVAVNSRARASDETVRISVQDDGVGMTPDVLAKAFDPFYSSRPAGRGRGLGLSRAQRLVEINGGRLWIESTSNQGTTATVELPGGPPVAPPPPTPHEPTPPTRDA